MTVFHALRQAKAMNVKTAAPVGTMTLRISTTKSIDKETSLLYLKEMGVILLMLVAFGIFWWIGYKERD
tara:strand:- start:1268 stop:1474 length:207 start_codon:yes stop_codon:yes gene_type:complete